MILNGKVQFDQILPDMAATPKYLVLFYGVSSGANGANLGSDERDLVTLVYLVLNTEENKVRITLHVYFGGLVQSS